MSKTPNWDDEIVCEICEAAIVARQQNKGQIGRVSFIENHSLDREGGNHEFSGEIETRWKLIYFDIQSGNWCGTDIRDWEEEYKNPVLRWIDSKAQFVKNLINKYL